MLNEEGSTELAKSTAKIYSVLIIGVEIAIAASIIFQAALAPGATALLVLGGVALLLILGTEAFHTLPCAIRAHQAVDRYRCCSRLWFPVYAALKASWP
ncbi:MAG: hypothetical protein P8Q18_10380 [Porticoccaceae bacterium]|nr:hypothetical protein [Porticoccaceae bacterium]